MQIERRIRRRIIGIVIASLMFANIGFAEIRSIEKNSIKMQYGHMAVSTFCVDGYKFIVARDDKNKAVSIDLKQMYEEKDGKSLPTKC